MSALAQKENSRLHQLQTMLESGALQRSGVLLNAFTAAEIAHLLESLPLTEREILWGLVGLSEDEDMFAPVMVSARRRALWLGVNLITAFLAAWVIGNFQGTIEQIVSLAVLMPIVAGMGGVAGTQTMTLAIRGIALGQLSSKNMRWLVIKEFAVGIINSLIWAVIIAIIAGIWFHDINIAWLIGVAMTINLLSAAVSGAVIPLLLDRFGIDPALAGGVFLTTVTDIIGFLAFLGLATYFLL